jgi:hypothetical protein
MKVFKNEKVIKRNKTIGTWTTLLALAVLGIGMYISFQRPDLLIYSAISLLLGFTLTQVGMYMGNRFGRSPRPDEKLDAGLKGLPGEFTLYHYLTPASHVLIGPAGIWVLMPYHQRGVLTYSRNRWRMSGGGVFQGYMRIFGQESLGRPELEVESEMRGVRQALEKTMPENEIPEIHGALIFTSESVEIRAEAAPMPALKLKQLKDFMRQKAKERTAGPAVLERVRDALVN